MLAIDHYQHPMDYQCGSNSSAFIQDRDPAFFHSFKRKTSASEQLDLTLPKPSVSFESLLSCDTMHSEVDFFERGQEKKIKEEKKVKRPPNCFMVSYPLFILEIALSLYSMVVVYIIHYSTLYCIIYTVYNYT